MSGKFEFRAGAQSNTIEVSQLRPGFRYNITILPSNDIPLERPLSLASVTACDCNDALVDNTGRPQNLNITQTKGHVTFEFKDNSRCEEAFSFTRVSLVEEFLLDFAENAVSFVSDYYFSSSQECNSKISPGQQASDDLSLRYVRFECVAHNADTLIIIRTALLTERCNHVLVVI